MGAIVAIFLLGLYFLPVIIGAVRSVPNIGSIAVINFFLGWTFVGWVVALAMACRSSSGSTQVHIHHPSPHPPSVDPPGDDQPSVDPELQDVIARAIEEHERQKRTLEAPPD